MTNDDEKKTHPFQTNAPTRHTQKMLLGRLEKTSTPGEYFRWLLFIVGYYQAAVRVLILAGLLLAASSPSFAATITLSAVDFGTDSFIIPSAILTFFHNEFLAAGQTFDLKDRAIMEFDISTLATGIIVTDAVFSVTDSGIGSVVPFANTYRRFGYVGDGTAARGDGTPSAGYTVLPNLIASNNAGDIYSVNVTAFVASLLSGSEDFAGFVIAEQAAENQRGFVGFSIPDRRPIANYHL